jgi:hypothetical protein
MDDWHEVPHMKEPTTLVWIDARGATIVRWRDGEVDLEQLESGVPAHHRSTGHVRHDPSFRHGGGGPAQTADEPRRLEHLARFIDRVSARLPADDAILILGPGTVRERLEHHLREADEQHGRTRPISGASSGQLTLAQLVARLRHAIGDDPPRRRVGPYRQSGPDAQTPHRLIRERPRDRRPDQEDADMDLALAATDDEGGS